MSTKEQEELLLPSRSTKWTQGRPRKFWIIVGGIIVTTIVIVTVIAVTAAVIRGNQSGSTDQPDAPSNFHDMFVEQVDASSIREAMRNFSSMSHIAGSQNDYLQALEMKQIFENYGLETSIEEHPVLLTYPLSRFVGLLEPSAFNCTLKEAVVSDGTSQLPAVDTFSGYSATGDVTAELVYANYGRDEDFKLLDKMNISVAGRIVIVRYGWIFRGNKVKLAEQRGAVGVLIYTDPGDYVQGPVYPTGPWSTNSTVQRGTIWTGNGDPETPGWPSVSNGPRLSVQDAKNSSVVSEPLPTIPVQPLSYGDAAPLLKALSGPLPDPSWQGGLNFSYHLGPGPAKVRIAIETNYTVTPVWNVLGKIPGEIEPDRTVIIGCHRDAWTFGAGDPISGTSTMLEIARVLQILRSKNWKPRRSIVFASWDAEEYALLGSVEYVEQHAKTLSLKAAFYLNLDIAVQGGGEIFDVEASPSMLSITSQLVEKLGIETWDNTVGPLGDGSDYTGFIQYVGVSASAPGFMDDIGRYDAVYHSNYDSFYWFSHFGDPDFSLHATMAKFTGLQLLLFTDSSILPYNVTDYATALADYVQDLESLNGSVSMAPLWKSVQTFSSAVNSLNNDILAAQNTVDPLILRSINDRLMSVDRSFLTDDPRVSGRPWYKHVIFSPSEIDAYSGATFPALHKAISQENWPEVEYLVGRTSIIIDSAAELLKSDDW